MENDDINRQMEGIAAPVVAMAGSGRAKAIGSLAKAGKTIKNTAKVPGNSLLGGRISGLRAEISGYTKNLPSKQEIAKRVINRTGLAKVLTAEEQAVLVANFGNPKHMGLALLKTKLPQKIQLMGETVAAAEVLDLVVELGDMYQEISEAFQQHTTRGKVFTDTDQWEEHKTHTQLSEPNRGGTLTKNAGSHTTLTNEESSNTQMAWFANDVYNDEGKRRNFGDFKYSSKHSNHNTGIYINKGTGKVVMAMRGSYTTMDWIRNRNIARGTFTRDPDFRRDRNLFKKLAKKYGKANIRLVGHSRGGTRARDLSYRTGAEATTFNAGYFLNATELSRAARCRLPKKVKPTYCDKLTSVRQGGDVVSLFGKRSYGRQVYQDTENLYAPGENHSMRNFVFGDGY